MQGLDEGNGGGHDGARRQSQDGLVSKSLAALARMLEAERDRWILWVPVLFGIGIISYFALANEPQMRGALALLLGALGLSLALRNARLGLAIGGAALAFASGFAIAKVRTETVRAPVLHQDLRYTEVSGFVEVHELRDKGRARITLRVLALGDLKPDETPYRVRVSLPRRYAADIRIGEAVKVKATLQPPPEPIEPGGFDFARRAWFDRLGGTGYAMSEVTPLTEAPVLPWDLAVWSSVDALRTAINRRIRMSLQGDTAEIAVALITGQRGGIPKNINEAMRDSGLTHILSISGLHMAIMAGTVFWLVRALLALVPGLSLRYPIKKWAALAALAAATFYLALSGAAVPTVRSWIMTSIVLIAVLLDRPAITMRNVALAALAILIVAPESLFEPSFEMSFAAVVGLVALYEWLAKRKTPGLHDPSPIWRGLRLSGAFVGGVAITTLIAGTAIAPFALYHFNRITHYGLVANLIAAPLVSLLIMPMAVLSLAAMPFGLEFWPLQAMGAGIDLMVATGEWVASWPGAVSILPQISGLALVLIVLGGLWLCLWQTQARAFGLVIVACGLALAPQQKRPDVLIERNGDLAALRSTRGNLVFPPATAANYSADNWLLADGDERDVATATDEHVFRCDSLGCIGVVKGKTVALIRHPGALEEDCRLADIVIAPFTISRGCRAARVIVDRRMLKAKGAHALYIEGLSIRTETVEAARGRRPWAASQ
jgi:competence protein ComEC